MHSSDTAQLVFEDVRVPAKNLIGEEGSGFIYQMIQFQQERIFGEFCRKLLFLIFTRSLNKGNLFTYFNKKHSKSTLICESIYTRLGHSNYGDFVP